jgi:hypothetical protein
VHVSRYSENFKDYVDLKINQLDHTKIDLNKQPRMSGEKRKRMRKEVVIKGTQLTRSCNILFNEGNPDVGEHLCTSSESLRKMKSEEKLSDRLSSDILTDVYICKQSHDSHCANNFIQEISMMPFGFLMISKYQVNIQHKI